MLLAGLAAYGFYGWDAERKTVKELEAQIEELKAENKLLKAVALEE